MSSRLCECVILYRNPSGQRRVCGITDGDGIGLRVFDSEIEAELFIRHHALCQAWPTQIVKLDEIEI